MRNTLLHSAKRSIFLIPSVFLFSCTNPAQLPDYSQKSCVKLPSNIAPSESEVAIVNKISDGDTFWACLPSKNGSIKIRVLGIDCPETRENAKCRADEKKGLGACAEQIPKGKQATEFAKKNLMGQRITLESKKNNGDFERDTYGRWLAYIRLQDGHDFGKLMVSKGLCQNYNWKYPHPRGEEYTIDFE